MRLRQRCSCKSDDEEENEILGGMGSDIRIWYALSHFESLSPAETRSECSRPESFRLGCRSVLHVSFFFEKTARTSYTIDSMPTELEEVR